MKPKTITISRQYGSGGREIAERLSKELGIPCYDNEVISMAAKESDIGLWEFSMAEDMRFTNFIYTLSNTTPHCEVQEATYGERIFRAQSEAIRKLADKGPGIFLGRCGSYVLRDRPDCAHIFVCGSLAQRAKRAVEVYGLDPKEAEREVARTDKRRASYYFTNTGVRWGFGPGYDLVVNTDKLGVDGGAALIKAYLALRE